MRVMAWPARSNADRNPYQRMLYDAIEPLSGAPVVEFGLREILRFGRLDILHVHWPDVFMAVSSRWSFLPRLALLRTVFALARLRGAKVVWTAHNYKRPGQRNQRLLETYFWPWFSQRVDGVIFTSQSAMDELPRQLPGMKAPCVAIPHGHYRSELPDPLPIVSMREVPCVAAVGSIVPFKNLTGLLRAFLEIPLGGATLRIQGEDEPHYSGSGAP